MHPTDSKNSFQACNKLRTSYNIGVWLHDFNIS
jgi:hypothetical protein